MSLKRDKRSKRQPSWLLDYVDENRLRYRKRVCCSRTVAQRLYIEILDEIEKRKLGISESIEYMTISELARDYLINSELNGKTDLTIKRIRNSSDAFQRIIGANTTISEVSPHLIERYKQKRLNEITPRKTRLTPGGLNSELKHLKALFNWAVKMGILNRSPFIGIDFIKTDDKPVRFLSNSELQKLYMTIKAESDQDACDLFTFYLQTGARRSELIPPKFTWNSVFFHWRQILLIGKRNRRRTVPVNEILIGILESRRLLNNPFNFSPDQVSRIVKKYYEKSDIDNASVHTLRKTCGAMLIQAGVDIYRVSKWLGHSSVTVTERHYVDLLQSDYEDLSRLLGENGAQYVPQNQVLASGKVVPYRCHFPDKTRQIQTN
ncbi:MAG: site-specific integrase [Candidatus Marinimicrobia bacterium]|nr:site-specific integrase [Candidatus Neomarinimicrobiota bacterium]